MKTGSALLVGICTASVAVAEPVLPPSAATVVQAVVDAVHADSRCAAWRDWTEIELQADRALLRPPSGPGRAVLIHATQRPWLRYDAANSRDVPDGAGDVQCLERAILAKVTHSVWRDPTPSRDRPRAPAVQPLAPVDAERRRTTVAVWMWLAIALGLSGAIGGLALRRLLARPTAR